MSKFLSGQSGNPQGRPKGVKNFTTVQAKAVLTGVLQRNLTVARVSKDLKALRPKERLETLVKIATFIIPRPQENNLKFDFEGLPPEKIEQIYSIIFNNDNNGNDIS